jgi:hypothetical protein
MVCLDDNWSFMDAKTMHSDAAMFKFQVDGFWRQKQHDGCGATP